MESSLRSLRPHPSTRASFVASRSHLGPHEGAADLQLQFVWLLKRRASRNALPCVRLKGVLSRHVEEAPAEVAIAAQVTRETALWQ